jgi:ABC-type sugar transport system substrate-binding protein
MKRSRYARVLTPFVALALVLATCVSSFTPAASAATVRAAAPTEVVDGLSGLALAKARVAEFSKAPSPNLPTTTPVTIPKKGIKIAYTWCAQVVCTAIAAGAAAAAKAIGGTFVGYHHEDTASTVSTAFTDAITGGADMVLTSGDPVQWFQSQLNTLNSKKVPVVAWSIPEPYHATGFAANVISNDDYYFNGVLEADYVAAQTNGHAHVLLESIPQYPVLATQSAGFEAEFAQVCKGCTVTVDNFSVPQLASGANVAATVSSLQKNTNTNWLAATCACLISQPLATAIKAAGFGSLKAVEADGTSTNYQLMKTHQLVYADLALAEPYLGWLAVNDGLLALDGKTVPAFKAPPLSTIPGHPDAQVAGLPIQFLTAADITNPNTPYDPIPGYQAKFLKLWGLG